METKINIRINNRNHLHGVSKHLRVAHTRKLERINKKHMKITNITFLIILAACSQFAKKYERALKSLIVILIIIALSFWAVSCSIIKPKTTKIDGMKMKQTIYGTVHKYQIQAIKDSKRVIY